MRRVLVVSLVVAASALGVAGGYLWQQRGIPAPQLQRATMVTNDAQPLQDFQLRDQDNQAFTRERFNGRWSLVFFGYTHCPDVCPLTLAEAKGFSDHLSGRITSYNVCYTKLLRTVRCWRPYTGCRATRHRPGERHRTHEYRARRPHRGLLLYRPGYLRRNTSCARIFEVSRERIFSRPLAPLRWSSASTGPRRQYTARFRIRQCTVAFLRAQPQRQVLRRPLLSYGRYCSYRNNFV